MLGLPARLCAALQQLPELDCGDGRRGAVFALGALEGAADEGIGEEGGKASAPKWNAVAGTRCALRCRGWRRWGPETLVRV
jgi:hypothetical protein